MIDVISPLCVNTVINVISTCKSRCLNEREKNIFCGELFNDEKLIFYIVLNIVNKLYILTKFIATQ